MNKMSLAHCSFDPTGMDIVLVYCIDVQYIYFHLFYIIRDLTVHQCCTVSLGHKETAALVPSAPCASDDAVAEQQSSSGRALVCTSWRYINGINGLWFINHGQRTINHGIVTMKLDRYKRPKQFNFHEIELENTRFSFSIMICNFKMVKPS